MHAHHKWQWRTNLLAQALRQQLETYAVIAASLFIMCHESGWVLVLYHARSRAKVAVYSGGKEDSKGSLGGLYQPLPRPTAPTHEPLSASSERADFICGSATSPSVLGAIVALYVAIGRD